MKNFKIYLQHDAMHYCIACLRMIYSHYGQNTASTDPWNDKTDIWIPTAQNASLSFISFNIKYNRHI